VAIVSKSGPAITAEVAGNGVAGVGRLGDLFRIGPKKLEATVVGNDVSRTGNLAVVDVVSTRSVPEGQLYGSSEIDWTGFVIIMK
jgi:hypothetical protein